MSFVLIALYASLWRWRDGQFVFGPDDYFARTFRFTFVSLGFALLLPWASLWKLENENFASLAVRKIALWSYALYLVHIPLIQLLMKYGYQDWRTSFGHALILFVFEIGGAILLSALLFRFFERPCTALREQRRARRCQNFHAFGGEFGPAKSVLQMNLRAES